MLVSMRKRAQLKGTECEPPPQKGAVGGGRITMEMGAGTAPLKCQIPTGISAFSQLPPLKHFLPGAEGDVHRVQPRNPDVYASS